MNSIKNVMLVATEKLEEHGIENPSFEAGLLLSYVLKCDRLYLHTHSEQKVDTNAMDMFNVLVRKRCKKCPYAYLVKNKEFMGLNFYVDKNVLIPRDDTEIVCKTVIDYCNENLDKHLKIHDLCCGSGTIGISVANFTTNTTVTMSDISMNAIEVASRNAKSILGECANSRIKLSCSNLFDSIYVDKFDVIVSNPPYIGDDEFEELDPTVKNYEPSLALRAEAGGLDFYVKIAERATQFLKDGGLIVLEIGAKQAGKVRLLLEGAGFYRIEVLRDLSGKNRCIKGIKL